MANSNNKPAFTLRDGRVKLTCWENATDNGSFHSVDLSKGYKDADEQWHETTQLTDGDILKAANLLKQAYNKIKSIE